MTAEQTTTIPLDLLNTLLERWAEVAHEYKANPDSPDDDLARRYSDYRHIYLRNIRDLRHVIDTGRMPCSLMTNDERGRGDCGRNHEDEHAKHGQTEEVDDPWEPDITRDQAMANIVTLHLAEALLNGKNEEVRVWARGLAHELKRERIDLIDDIGQHMQRMALDAPTNDIPF